MLAGKPVCRPVGNAAASAGTPHQRARQGDILLTPPAGAAKPNEPGRAAYWFATLQG